MLSIIGWFAFDAILIIWGGVILFSHMNIARCYFEFFYIDILGGIGGYIALLKLSSYLQNVKIIANVLSFVGRNSIVYLCFHYIINVYFHFNMNDFLFFVLQIIVISMVVVLLNFTKTTKEPVGGIRKEGKESEING